MKKNKSIKSKMIKVLSGAFVLLFVAAFTSAHIISKRSFTNIKDATMEKIVVDAAKMVESQLSEKFALAKAIAANELISDMTKTMEDKKETLLKYCEDLGIRSIGIMDTNADFITTDGFTNNLSERQYFKDLMNDKVYISNPQIEAKTGDQIIFLGVPLKNDGKIVGAITCSFDSSFLSEDIEDLKYLDMGKSYILDPLGNIVASHDFEDVIQGVNVTEDTSISDEVAVIYEKMMAGESNLEIADNNYYAYSSIPNVDGWSIVMEVDEKDVNRELIFMGRVFIIIGIIGVLTFLYVIYRFGNVMGSRLNILKESIEVLADGIFNEELDAKELEREDEIGIINRALKNTKTSIINILNEVKNNANIMNEESKVLGNTSSEISLGANNISEAMHQTAEGNTNQHGELVAINNEMELFASNIEVMNRNIENVAETSAKIQSILGHGNESIEELNISVNNFDQSFGVFNRAIVNMNEKISSIENITSTISSIAEQTNLLALNAAIEAARAGEAGKGFSVVAEEIRKLADQSQQSVSEIGTIISNVIQESSNIISSTEQINDEVRNQKDKIHMSVDSFNNIEKLLSDLTPMISEVFALSEDSNERKDTILGSLQAATSISEELAAATEEVDATAEEFKNSSNEISKVSIELAEIIEKLNDSIEKFKI